MLEDNKTVKEELLMGQLQQQKLTQWLYMRESIDLKRKRIETVEEEAGKEKIH